MDDHDIHPTYDDLQSDRQPTTPKTSPRPIPNSPAFTPQFPPSPKSLTDAHHLPAWDETQYIRSPDRHTVTQYPDFNLPSLGLIINTFHRVVICISCSHAVTIKNIHLHVKKHSSFVQIPPCLEDTIREEYGIDDADPDIPRDCPAPIFGLMIEEQPMYFCSRCGRGFQTLHILQSHQRSLERCPSNSDEPATYTRGYAQSFFLGARRAFFEVNADLLDSNTTDTHLYQTAFLLSVPPPDDYSQIPLTSPAHDLDLGNFMHRERWIEHLEGYKPIDLNAMVDEAQDDETTLLRLRVHVVDYLSSVAEILKKHSSFGIHKLFAQTGQ